MVVGVVEAVRFRMRHTEFQLFSDNSSEFGSRRHRGCNMCRDVQQPVFRPSHSGQMRRDVDYDLYHSSSSRSLVLTYARPK